MILSKYNIVWICPTVLKNKASISKPAASLRTRLEKIYSGKQSKGDYLFFLLKRKDNKIIFTTLPDCVKQAGMVP
jgi:hypothetical protein